MNSTSAILTFLILFAFSLEGIAQKWVSGNDSSRVNRSMFRPLEDAPTPNEFRSASGKPGYRYWQQRVDYDIRTSLDTIEHKVIGSERITYYNNSPDELNFLWIQLDQNLNSIQHSRTYASRPALPPKISERFRQFIDVTNFDGGHQISRVQLVDAKGKLVDAKTYINGTVMRVNLLQPLKPKEKVQLEIDWSYRVPDNGRGAKELVRDGWLYEIAQWFPRLCVYDDVNGWQTDQYLGTGEFYLNFGNYNVEITVPWNHIVQATGVLQNPNEVLTAEQQRRLKEAFQSETPRYIIKPEEVMRPETRPKQSGTLTWKFKAENVRDFAWVSSKTYVWDAAGFRYEPNGRVIECHSLYPRDAMPLWNKVSTKAIIQTLKTYGRMAFPYPYPKVVNVHGPVFGMEYPMICFCGARPAADGSYTEQLENALVAVTIHEVGHNWFPMIVASDERKYGWMDEGLNTFLEYYACLEWDPQFPARRGPAKYIVQYMRDPNQVPIMSHSDIVPDGTYGNNAYSKPAAGLVMLRENILTPQVFDDAFREYAQTWAFKHPQPHDFFRIMNNAVGEDLSWFWRGWFYTTHYNDQAIAEVEQQLSDSLMAGISATKGKYYYRIKVKNKGGLVLPLEMEVTYTDGTKEVMKMPIDIWRKDETQFIKGFFSDKELEKVVLDPREVYADIDRSNNAWERSKAKPATVQPKEERPARPN